jgi:hypothetical protein
MSDRVALIGFEPNEQADLRARLPSIEIQAGIAKSDGEKTG